MPRFPDLKLDSSSEQIEERINALQVEKEELERELIEARKREASCSGEIVDSPEKLKCEKHPYSAFELHVMNYDGSKVKIYFCKECTNDDSISIDSTSCAHYCPCCNGIVKGPMSERYKKSPQEDWEGMHYHCHVCDELLGTHYWGFS